MWAFIWCILAALTAPAPWNWSVLFGLFCIGACTNEIVTAIKEANEE